MITLIIVKWLTFYPDTSNAPAIITYMIEMFLNFGSISGDALIHSHGLNETLHIFLLFIAFLCVPTMLLMKPYIIWKKSKHHKDPEEMEMHEIEKVQKKKLNKYHRFEEEEDQNIGMPTEENKEFDGFEKGERNQEFEDLDIPVIDSLKEQLYASVSDIMGEENHSISEISIHQLIETIEFVLGTVSNTASYLRLWALSLAHSQLAAVFYEKILGEAFEGSSTIGLFILFPMFATATFGVLMCMDSME